MARGSTLKAAFASTRLSTDIPTAYTRWCELAAQRDKWRAENCNSAGQPCKEEPNVAKQMPAMYPQATWAQLVGGPALHVVLEQRRPSRERRTITHHEHHPEHQHKQHQGSMCISAEE
jgi:hypothetical protein